MTEQFERYPLATGDDERCSLLPWNFKNGVYTWIQMRGRWLNEAGFAIGTKVKVRVRPGRLVLMLVEE